MVVAQVGDRVFGDVGHEVAAESSGPGVVIAARGPVCLRPPYPLPG